MARVSYIACRAGVAMKGSDRPGPELAYLIMNQWTTIELAGLPQPDLIIQL